jgi:hypothetical protein
MALDPTARKTNIKDSLKKYFIDSLKSGEGIAVTFDIGLGIPKSQGVEAERWVSVNLGDIDIQHLSRLDLRVFCCTRKDAEGFKLAQLRDTTLGYLTDTSQTDGMRRISFYRSSASQAWELLGAFVVQEVHEAGEGTTEDETKFTLLVVTLRWASKV